MRALGIALTVGMLLIGAANGQSNSPAVLSLEVKIPLGAVRGRIDHLAVDVVRKRLFIAELGNNSLGVVDLGANKLLRRMQGLTHPQGVGFFPSVNTVYVANAGDGSVRLFEGETLAPAGRIELGEDADNVRVDIKSNAVLVGYGAGAIAVIDPVTRARTENIALPAHPESFQLDFSSGQIFVNMPESKAIGVVDRATNQLRTSWPTGNKRGNFAMALDEGNQHAIVVFRNPPTLVVFAMKDGGVVAERETCGDSDDVFFDANRSRVYVVCGDGHIDVFDASTSYQLVARLKTVPGARTALFISALDCLALAVRAHGSEPAAVWIFKASP